MATNKENAALYSKLYRTKHKEKIAAYRAANAERAAAYQRSYYAKNREQVNAKNRQYYYANKEQIGGSQVAYRAANRKKRTTQRKVYLDSNINARLAHNLRSRLRLAVFNGQKSGSAVRDLGCSIEFFKVYIAMRFEADMSWENYGKWHLDHIKPLVLFDLTDRAQFLEACHYTNYQPLWGIDNISKGIKYVTI
jgi:hypothetical protein